MCTLVQNPVPRLIIVRRDHTSGLFLPDSDVTIELDNVTSSSGLCVVESTSSFYWIDDVTSSLTADSNIGRVSRQILGVWCGFTSK